MPNTITTFAGLTPSRTLFQRLRLSLSTYQDGSGQLTATAEKTLPGWRDFERSVAFVFGGRAQENKAIFDVVVPDADAPGRLIGISCKMRSTLKETMQKNFVTLELSNSAGQFWNAIRERGLHEQNYREHPSLVASAILERVRLWHEAASNTSVGNVDLSRSFFLTLSWDLRSGQYQLHQFRHILPDSNVLTWSFPDSFRKGEHIPGRRLVGFYQNHKLLERYGQSGGQLKYYPLTKDAIWQSELFTLEPLLDNDASKNILLAKIQSYFPGLWEQTSI
jgi:hypothetical protein